MNFYGKNIEISLKSFSKILNNFEALLPNFVCLKFTFSSFKDIFINDNLQFILILFARKEFEVMT